MEAQGFSAAARALGLSKSAVSKAVGQLEDRLGARLLNRTTRRLSLTDAGAAYYEGCVKVLAEAEEAELAVTRLQESPRGLLKVNAPMTFGVLHLAPCLPDFLQAHPELNIELSLDDRVVDLVEEGLDVAVRVAKLPDSSLIARRLAPSRRVWAASPEYLARNGAPEHPRELARHRVMLYSLLLGPADEWRWETPEGEAGSVRLTGCLKANNGEVLRQAALSGLGLIFSPTFIVGRDLCEGRLVEVLRPWADSSGSDYAVYPHNRHLSAKVRAFVDFLAGRFGPVPYWEGESQGRAGPGQA